MAFYDASADTIILRVVYDGMGTAGKTTNIDQICAQFSAAREGQVYSPEVVRGRTLYFDWLELNAGRLDGHRLRCQVVTVPGQFAYVQRRWELLRFPDAVVAVCDSSADALTRSKIGLALLRKTLAVRRMDACPIVVQANKQDLPGAIPPDELARKLGIGPPNALVPASALTGSGVRRTLMTAIHSAAERVRARLEAGEPSVFDPVPESPQALYERLKACEDTGELEEGARIADTVLVETPGAET